VTRKVIVVWHISADSFVGQFICVDRDQKANNSGEKEESQGIIRMRVDHCECHIARRYGLPCYHFVPTNGDAIPLDSVGPFWRLDNWDEGAEILFHANSRIDNKY